jgi:hypothetical protein
MFYFIFINYSLPPNQSLPSRKQRDAKNAQADGVSSLQIAWLLVDLSFYY